MADNDKDKQTQRRNKNSKEEAEKTDTSRLKIKHPESKKQSAGMSGDQKHQRADQTQKQPAGDEDTSVTDPMSLRDTNTAKVRRVTGGKGGPEATAVIPGGSPSGKNNPKTDTVQLKVVQQKKKEIADMMSPSSTVRLRSPGGKHGKGGAHGSKQSRDTLKVPAPDQEKAKSTTEKPEGTQQVSAEQKPKTSTQPLKKMSSKEDKKSGSGKTLKTSGQTARRKPVKKGGRTLKVKSGAKTGQRTTKTSAGKEGEKTVKVPSDQGEETVKVSSEGAGQTVKAGAKTGLRLKQKSESSAGGAAPAQQPEVAAAVGAEEQPGIFYTLASIIACAGAAVLLYFMISQYITHIYAG